MSVHKLIYTSNAAIIFINNQWKPNGKQKIFGSKPFLLIFRGRIKKLFAV